MPRRTFFSFHYQRDIWRVNQVRNGGAFIGTAAAGFVDASLWEEAKRKGDAQIKKMIDAALHNTSVTVVCIGAKTAGRTYINYEINESIARGNALLGLRINHLKDQFGEVDPDGEIPALLARHNVSIRRFTDVATLGAVVEQLARAR